MGAVGIGMEPIKLKMEGAPSPIVGPKRDPEINGEGPVCSGMDPGAVVGEESETDIPGEIVTDWKFRTMRERIASDRDGKIDSKSREAVLN